MSSTVSPHDPAVHADCQCALPGANLKAHKMPGHWLLARLGKRVLRPGGIELTRILLDTLAIGAADEVIEFAPGLGVTAQLTLARNPASYTAVERDSDAATRIASLLLGGHETCITASAEETGLPAASATVIYGEAMLSMQPPAAKQAIISEAARLLKPGGHYGIHELCLHPEDLAQSAKDDILARMSEAVHVGVRPLTIPEWRHTLESQGLRVREVRTAPFHLLEPRRMIQDEGLFGAARFVSRVLRDADARRRVLAMRRTFRRYRDHLAAVMIIAEKPEDASGR